VLESKCGLRRFWKVLSIIETTLSIRWVHFTWWEGATAPIGENKAFSQIIGQFSLDVSVKSTFVFVVYHSIGDQMPFCSFNLQFICSQKKEVLDEKYWLKGQKNFHFNRIRNADCTRCRNELEEEDRIRGQHGKGCDKRRRKERE
jgi:hypothetical protein